MPRVFSASPRVARPEKTPCLLYTSGLGPRADEALDPLRTGEFAFTVKKRASKSRSASRARRAVDLVREEAALDARPRVGDDAELFEELRDLRRELADEHQVLSLIHI